MIGKANVIILTFQEYVSTLCIAYNLEHIVQRQICNHPQKRRAKKRAIIRKAIVIILTFQEYKSIARTSYNLEHRVQDKLYAES